MVGKGDKERKVGVKLKSNGGAHEEALYKRNTEKRVLAGLARWSSCVDRTLR